MKMLRQKGNNLLYTINNIKESYSEKGQNNMMAKEVRRLMSDVRRQEEEEGKCVKTKETM